MNIWKNKNIKLKELFLGTVHYKSGRFSTWNSHLLQLMFTDECPSAPLKTQTSFSFRPIISGRLRLVLVFKGFLSSWGCNNKLLSCGTLTGPPSRDATVVCLLSVLDCSDRQSVVCLLSVLDCSDRQDSVWVRLAGPGVQTSTFTARLSVLGDNTGS